MYADPQQYAIRTVGLPQLGALGVCFGKVITAMEPGSGKFSWSMVVSHELAHVFAIQLSKSRVPRWFTEGLSEWETAQAQPHWRRAGDADLAAALASGHLRGLADLNLSFTRARSMDEMVAAYYQSYVSVDFLARRFGFPKLLEMLRLWGQGKQTSEVLLKATGISIEKIDAELRAEIEKRTAPYRAQFHVRYEETGALPKDAPQWKVGLAKLAAHDVAAAEAAAKAAGEGKEAWVLRGEIALAKRDAKAAQAAYEKAITAGADGYDMRMRLATSAEHAGDLDKALAEYARAATFDPQKTEPFEERAEILEKRHDTAGALAELEKAVALDPNAGPAAHKLALAAAAKSDWPRTAKFAQRAIECDPFDADAQDALAKALDALGKRKEATEARESAKLARERKGE
jgi:Tfp pilus assembly protein PilF